MRDRNADETFIRNSLKSGNIDALVYITSNPYDGGYEVKIDSREVFVDYDLIDRQDTTWVYEKN